MAGASHSLLAGQESSPRSVLSGVRAQSDVVTSLLNISPIMDSKLLFPLATAFLVLCLVETGESVCVLGLSWCIEAPIDSYSLVSSVEDGGYTSVRGGGLGTPSHVTAIRQ